MLWVLQRKAHRYQELLDTLTKLNIPYVEVTPFEGRVLLGHFDAALDNINDFQDADIDDTQPIMVCGSTGVTRIADQRGWQPGSFANENFDFPIWRDGFGAENVLNGDAIVGHISDIAGWEALQAPYFVRPTEDTKSFSGRLMTTEVLLDWQTKVKQHLADNTPFQGDLSILISGFKQTVGEYRLFVVNGKIVGSSRYKLGNMVVASSDVPDSILTFGQTMIDRWQPAAAFVLDVCEVANNDQYQVVEINNINSSGFYDADIDSVVTALTGTMTNT